MEEIINSDLKKYIEENIFKVYDLNEEAHGLNHIKTVLNRAFELSINFENINYDMLYTAVTYHDIGDHIDRKNHEKISAEWMMNDKELDKYFNVEQKIIIKEAIEDHRASSKNIPRNIYGKILSSADRNVDVDVFLYRTFNYGLEHYKNLNFEEQIQKVYEHAIDKYGKNGYAVSKFYIRDDKYSKYLEDLQKLIDSKEEFFERTRKIVEKKQCDN